MSGLVYTDTVFNVIGDYPVVDQFDVSYTGLLTGSMNDRYITGSLFFQIPTASPDVKITIFDTRGKAFSKLGKNTQNFPKVGIDSSYNLQSWGERSGFVRNTRIFSRSERYRDSLAPSYKGIIDTLNGAVDTSTQQAIISIGLVAATPPPPLTYATALGFHESFPFEPKFSSINRTKKIFSDYENHKIRLIEEGGISASEQGSEWYDLFIPTEYLLSSDLGKIFFGFGDRIKKIKTGPTTFIGQKYLPSARFSPLFSHYYRSVGPIIRGWKYGLISASPYYTSAVFRRDRFGQFRDMLEQRPLTATVKDVEYSPVNYFGDVETKAFVSFPPVLDKVEKNEDPETLSAVSVSFCKLGIKQLYKANGEEKQVLSYISLNPTETSSSNLSRFVTSSLPYYCHG